MNLFEPLPISDSEQTLAHEITQMVDHFAEYSSVNAFLCSSFTSIMSSNEPIRPEVIQGAKQCAETIQARGQELKTILEHIRKRSLAEVNG